MRHHGSIVVMLHTLEEVFCCEIQHGTQRLYQRVELVFSVVEQARDVFFLALIFLSYKPLILIFAQ